MRKIAAAACVVSIWSASSVFAMDLITKAPQQEQISQDSPSLQALPGTGQQSFVFGDWRIVLADPVFQAFRKQRGLTAIDPLNEAPHPILPQIARESYRGNQSRRCVFTQAGSSTEMAALAFDIGFTLNIRHSFDSSARQFR